MTRVPRTPRVLFTTSLACALALGLTLGACDAGLSGPGEAAPTDAESVTSKGHHPPPAKLAQQLNTVRQVTKTYRDIEAARADGYVAVSPYVPGMGFHFAQSVPPFGANRTDPPVLVYFTNGSYNPAPGETHDSDHDDDLILGAVEWIVPGDQTGSPPDLFNDEDSPRRLKVTEEHGWHYESAEDFTGLHAWVHRGNPAGVFHPTNPTIE